MVLDSRVLPVASAVCVAVLLTTVILTQHEVRNFEGMTQELSQTLYLAIELRQSSDDLTRFIRTYTVTGNASYWDMFQQVKAIRDGEAPLPVEPYRVYWDLYIMLDRSPRELTAPRSMKDRMLDVGFTSDELALVQEAEARSNKLVDLETVAYNAMQGRYRPFNTTGLTVEEAQAFSVTGPPDEEYARQLVHGWDYHLFKAEIMEPLDMFFVKSRSRTESLQSVHDGMKVLTILQIVAVGMLMAILAISGYAQYESLCEKRRLVKAKAEAEDAADAISSFDLRSVEYLESIDKPDMLQAGFLKIMRNLRLYKPYLPPHLYGDTDAHQSDAKQASDQSRSSSTSQTRTTQSLVVETRERTAVGVQKRRVIAVSVLCDYDCLEPTDVTDYIAFISDLLVSAAADVHGTVAITPTGQFVVTFTAGRCISREQGAHAVAKALLHAKNNEHVTRTKLCAGIATGVDLCGNAGGDHLRGYVYAGKVVRQAICFAEVARACGAFVLVEEECHRTMSGCVAVMRVKVLFVDHASYLYEVVGEKEVANEEWLYQLQEMEKTPVARISEAVKSYLDGKGADISIVPDVLQREELVRPYSFSWLKKRPVYQYGMSRVVCDLAGLGGQQQSCLMCCRGTR